MVNNRSGTVGGGYNEEYSGVMSSPSRFQHELLLEHMNNDEETNMRLRNPVNEVIQSPQVLPSGAPAGAPSTTNGDRIEVCVLDALQHTAQGDLSSQVGCYDLRLIEAEKMFNE